MRGRRTSARVLWALGAGLLAWLVASLLVSTCLHPDREAREFGERVRLQGQREVLAWDLWVEANGRPPGYSAWYAENADRYPAHSPNGVVHPALAKLRDAPRGTPRARAADDIESVVDLIRRDGHDDLATAYDAWRNELGEVALDPEPGELLDRYAAELEGGDSEDADRARSLAALRAAVGRAG